MVDIAMFKESGLAEAFGRRPDGKRRRRGIADRGYRATNEDHPCAQALVTPAKKSRGGSLTLQQIKEAQIVSAVRIEVERAIGRLKTLKILDLPFRSKAPLERKMDYHRALVIIGICMTNIWFEYNPLRKEPHWLLCQGDIDAAKVNDLVAEFIQQPENVKLNDFLASRGGVESLKK